MTNRREGMDSLLGPYRVLDLTDEKGFLCGKILGDLGADVIKVEKPTGDPSRSIGPFYHDVPHPERSLLWFALNNNKRGITLDIETTDGREIFKKLVKTADFVIVSFSPRYMDNLVLSYSELSKVNPRIIVTSITPFGQGGPYKDYKASDIVIWAMAGMMYLCGDPDRAPVQVSFPQSYVNAGAEAAVGTMIAHYYRQVTGEGQHVDVSMQESVCMALMEGASYWDLNKVHVTRKGVCQGGVEGIPEVQRIWPCRDGYMLFYLGGGRFGLETNKALVQWMDSEGMATHFLKNKDWETYERLTQTEEEAQQISYPIGEFFKAHSKEELYEGAISRRIMLHPVATIEDIIKDPQLQAREFWQEIEHGELGEAITYPGTFAQLAETRCKIKRRAPLIGEHNQEIYEVELGFSKEELLILKQAKII